MRGEVCFGERGGYAWMSEDLLKWVRGIVCGDWKLRIAVERAWLCAEPVFAREIVFFAGLDRIE